MSNNRPLVIIGCVVLAVIGGTLWYLNTKQVAPVSTTPHSDIKVPIGPTLNIGSDSTPAPVAPLAKLATPKPTATPAPTRPLQDWEVKIDDVLRSSADETQTAQILINMLPTLPADGQAEAAQHITNLITDEQYNRVLPLVKNPSLPEEVLDVFVTDLMNREDKVKLPTLLDIAKSPTHPHHEEALSDLEILIDEDFESVGKDWGKMEQGVKNYLKKQAAEEAADATPNQ